MLENVILIESSIKNLLNMIWLKGHRVALLLVGGDATIMVHAKGQKICTALGVPLQGKNYK